MSRITYRWKHAYFAGPFSLVMSNDQTAGAASAKRREFNVSSSGARQLDQGLALNAPARAARGVAGCWMGAVEWVFIPTPLFSILWGVGVAGHIGTGGQPIHAKR